MTRPDQDRPQPAPAANPTKRFWSPGSPSQGRPQATNNTSPPSSRTSAENRLDPDKTGHPSRALALPQNWGQEGQERLEHRPKADITGHAASPAREGGLRKASQPLQCLISGALAIVLVGAAHHAEAARPKTKKIVFIAGKKSHGPGDHEYEKGSKLLAQALETSPNLKGYRTEVHLDGWPKDPTTLDDADSIVLYSDGSDHSEKDHPILEGDRLDTLDRAMKRGAGVVALHYTVFVPVKRGGPQFLDWMGGFFDYETGDAPNKWYSRIKHAETMPYPPTPSHPVARGIKPFLLKEEYYYRMRFREPDPRRVPLLATSLPGEPAHETVAWGVQREDGGRGFAYTGGHFHSNWDNDNLRRLVLNAIVWTAKGEVPKGGVDSNIPEAAAEDINALILTGHHHPAHDWKATTAALKQMVGRDRRFRFRTLQDPEALAGEDLAQVDLIIQNFNNWERPTLTEASRKKLLDYVRGGGGLAVIHFANGAWLDWPDYRRLSRRTWIEGTSGHDAHGPFRVEITQPDHVITKSIAPFDITDELYFKQQGDLPIEVLATAKSKVTGQDEPMAFTFSEGQGRVFQTVLGHDAGAIRTPGAGELIRRGATWAAGETPVDLPPPAAANPVVPGRAGNALNARAARAEAPASTDYTLRMPLTVECWAKLDGKTSFNVLVANETKESAGHWELYTTNGTGAFSVYMPGLEPSVMDSGVDVADGKWHRVTMVHAAMPKVPDLRRMVYLYVDGKQVKATRVQVKGGERIAGPLWFGGYPPGGIGCDGLVDEVRILQGAGDVENAEAPFTPTGRTLGHWTFDAATADGFPNAVAPGAAKIQVFGQELQAPREWTSTAAWPQIDAGNSQDWPNVGNDKGGQRYSPLKQINRENVAGLKVAWTYNTGDAAAGNGSTIECTPIVVGGVMYVTTARINVAALDAATGKEIWRYDPVAGGVNRGVAYWSDGKPNGRKRIMLGTSDGRLISLDARTGLPDRGFGKGGTLDLRYGVERDLTRVAYGVTSAPAVYENLVLVGFLVSEGQPGAAGDIRAFDVRTGREVWRFNTVPRPFEFGADTWEGDSWKDRSGANAWPGFTVDAKRGVVFCGTGSAASDFYGGDRKGANLFANCTLALDARTGKRLWHFQTVHHDIWDHDNPTPPVVVTVEHNGRKIDAVAQVTKTGHTYLFDRLTGEPLFGVREVPVPASDVPGEVAYPTQPMPLKPPPFSRQAFTDTEITDLNPAATAAVKERLKTLRYGQPHTPPSERGSVIMPGFHGGATWSGASFDPSTGLLYVNSNNVPYISVLRKNTANGYDFAGYTYFNDPDGYPANRPPWGNLTAIDLNKGEIAWQIPLGEYAALQARGIPATGTENFGGTIVTAGGLVFVGASKDEKFRAFDKGTGKLLWERQLPAGGYATPTTYSVNGTQYVVIAAGGGGKLGTKSGDSFIAFALPGVRGQGPGSREGRGRGRASGKAEAD